MTILLVIILIFLWLSASRKTDLVQLGAIEVISKIEQDNKRLRLIAFENKLENELEKGFEKEVKRRIEENKEQQDFNILIKKIKKEQQEKDFAKLAKIINGE